MDTKHLLQDKENKLVVASLRRYEAREYKHLFKDKRKTFVM